MILFYSLIIYLESSCSSYTRFFIQGNISKLLLPILKSKDYHRVTLSLCNFLVAPNNYWEYKHIKGQSTNDLTPHTCTLISWLHLVMPLFLYSHTSRILNLCSPLPTSFRPAYLLQVHEPHHHSMVIPSKSTNLGIVWLEFLATRFGTN